MKYLAALLQLSTPALVWAQKPTGTGKTFSKFVYDLGGFFQNILIIIIGLSFAAFLWGLARSILSVGNAEKNSEARTLIVWGVIGLVVSLSVIGILDLVSNTIPL